jgi:hypothetical protein
MRIVFLTEPMTLINIKTMKIKTMKIKTSRITMIMTLKMTMTKEIILFD